MSTEQPAAPVDLVMVAGTRAAQLRRMAAQADAITWKTSAVLREQASLILTMAARIKELEAELAGRLPTQRGQSV